MTDKLDIYHKQGFANPVGIGAAPAVVGFTDPAHFGGGNIGSLSQTVPGLAPLPSDEIEAAMLRNAA